MNGQGASDEALLHEAVSGDDAAFAELVRRHTELVHAVCWRHLRDAADVQDAVQETFLAVHRGAGSFSGRAKFTTWLYRVATNVCHDLVRKRVRRPQTVGFDPEWLGEADDDIGTAELGMDLAKALKALNPDHQRAVLLHSLHGYTYVEIAERLGASVGTIKSRVHRGLAQMARAMPRDLDDRSGESMKPSGPTVRPTRERTDE